MFIKLFHNSLHSIAIGLFFIAFLLWIDVFFVLYSTGFSDFNSVLYAPIVRAFGTCRICMLIISFLLMLINAFTFNKILSKYDVLHSRTYVPALIFIVVRSSLAEYQLLHPAQFSVFFIILAVERLCYIYQNTHAYTKIFDLGLFIGLASLFYPNSLFLLLFVWIILVSFQVFSLRIWLITIIGFFTPLIFAGTYFFWIDGFSWFYDSYLNVFSISVPVFKLAQNSFIVVCIIVFYGAIGLGRLLLKMNEKVIRRRKILFLFIWLFFIVLVSTLLFAREIHHNLLILLIPGSLFIANLFMMMRKRWLAEFSFLMILGAILYYKIACYLDFG